MYEPSQGTDTMEYIVHFHTFDMHGLNGISQVSWFKFVDVAPIMSY